MSTKKLRTIENLIILTFPVVLFAGCAGSDIKSTSENQIQSSVSQQQSIEITDPISTTSVSLPESLTISDAEKTIKSFEMETNENLIDQPVITDEISTDTDVVAIPEKKIYYFDTNAHVLSDDQRNELQKHADYLIKNPGAVLVINGHADVRGSEDYNYSLSLKRAMQTRQLLIEIGVAETQLITKGFGELVPMHAENNWNENRRIELEYSTPVVLSSMQ